MTLVRHRIFFKPRERIMRHQILNFTLQSESVNVCKNAAEEGLENTKQRIGGQRIAKRCMKDTTFVGRTSRRFPARLAVDQREASHHLLPKFREKWRMESPSV